MPYIHRNKIIYYNMDQVQKVQKANQVQKINKLIFN